MMFCPKCGTKALDGAEFCQKCGAKLIVDAPTEQSAATSRTNPSKQPNPSLTNTPEKKKSKLPIILGAAAALIIILVIIAAIGSKVGSDPSTDNSQPPAGYLTYKNAAEGISFQYPDTLQEGSLSEAGTYFTDDSMTMIMYLLVPTVNGGQSPILNIRKAPATQSVIDSVFSDTLSNVEPEGNMMVTNIDDGTIGDIPYRKYTLVTKSNSGSDVTLIRYIYFVNSSQYRVEFSGFTDDMESNEIKNFIADLMDSYTIRTDSSAAPSNSTPAAADQLLFQGTPIQSIMGAHSTDIISIFGEPEMSDETALEYNVMDTNYMIFNLDSMGQVEEFTGKSSDFTFDEQELSQAFPTIVTILGDNFTEVGATEYSYLVTWPYGKYLIALNFYLNSDSNYPYSITIMKSDSDIPTGDDDYSWVEGDIDDSLLRDQALVGRWRAYDGGSVEFDEYGNAVVSFTAYPDAEQKPYALAWTANNGQLTLISYFSLTERWTISENTLRLTLPNGGYSTYSRDEESESLLGTWNCLGNSIRKYSKAHVGALVLLPDGTGEVERVFSNLEFVMQPVTWWADDTNLYTSWSQQLTYDYSVSGDMLTIYFSNGSQIYTKVGN